MAKLASAIHERWGRLDVMIANAGVLGVLTPVAHLDEAIWDEVIDTNLSAVWRMIRVFDPLLRLSGAGRAVLVTSTAAGVIPTGPPMPPARPGSKPSASSGPRK